MVAYTHGRTAPISCSLACHRNSHVTGKPKRFPEPAQRPESARVEQTSVIAKTRIPLGERDPAGDWVDVKASVKKITQHGADEQGRI